MNTHYAIHSNGGARVAGTECHVSCNSFCDKDSRIEQSKVFHSSLVQSSVTEGSVVVGSQLSRCLVIASIIDGAIVDGPTLRDVVIENCELYGAWKLENAFVSHGIWHRAPCSLIISGESAIEGYEVYATLTESTDGYALIGSKRKPISKWIRVGEHMGKRLGWKPEQVRQGIDFFVMLRDCPLQV